jgi:hypothetical protein
MSQPLLPTPAEMVAYLDRFVRGQARAKLDYRRLKAEHEAKKRHGPSSSPRARLAPAVVRGDHVGSTERSAVFSRWDSGPFESKEAAMSSVDTVFMKVQRILTGHYKLKVQLDGDSLLVAFSDMSTTALVRVVEWGTNAGGESQSLVRIECPILVDVPATPALYEWVARNSALRHFGAIRLWDGEESSKVHLSMTHTLLGDTLDPEELGTALFLTLRDADQLDDELQKQFGGQRIADLRKD